MTYIRGIVPPRLRRFRDDRSGAAIILAAIMMPMLIGGMGLGAETGYRYYNQRLLQHAADFSAFAGAVRKYQGDSKSAIDAAALHVATQSAFSSAAGTITVNIPPTSGAFTGNTSAVEVILRETRPRLFSAVFSKLPVQVEARAVAAATAGTSAAGCILALSGTSAGAVTVTGNSTVNLTGCSVVSNSNSPSSVSLPNASAILNAECIATVGGLSQHPNAQVNTNNCIKTGAASTQDPYYWVQEPSSSCVGGQTRNVGQPNQTTNVTTTAVLPNGVPVGYFCNGIAARGIVNFAPGIYIISGNTMTSFGSNTAEFNGTGVTFFLTNGASLNFGANTTLNLNAPTTGPYAGLLFFSSRSNTAAHSIQGTPNSIMQGAVYTPAAQITFKGNSATSGGCTQIIGNTVTLTGNSTLTANCPNSGTQQIGGQVIALVE